MSDDLKYHEAALEIVKPFVREGAFLREISPTIGDWMDVNSMRLNFWEDEAKLGQAIVKSLSQPSFQEDLWETCCQIIKDVKDPRISDYLAEFGKFNSRFFHSVQPTRLGVWVAAAVKSRIAQNVNG